MQGNDHAALAHFLLQSSNNEELQRHKKAFLLGCLEPDINPLTYIRGSIRFKAFHGHNAENSKRHIIKCISELQDGGLRSSFSYFTFGTLIHYVADSFTFPHNSAFKGNVYDHVKYEKKLHWLFLRMLAEFQNSAGWNSYQDIREFFEIQHNHYCAETHSFQTDCRHILNTCTKLFDQILCHSYADTVYPIRNEEEIYENTYRHELIKVISNK